MGVKIISTWGNVKQVEGYIGTTRDFTTPISESAFGGDVLKFHIGNGIQFLPGDINGLQIKLDYLLAEYRAGNTSATRNQIVAIADELLRRKQLSRTKYNSINNCIQHLEE